MALSDDKSCILCCQSHEGSVFYGEMLIKDDVAVHQFCLLFSTHLYAEEDSQHNQNDENSLELYDLSKIKSYAEKHGNHKCIFCSSPSATIKCHMRSCTRRFHYKCGFDSEKCLFKFDTLFFAFCPAHTAKPKHRPNIDDTCVVCLTDLGDASSCGQISLNCRPYLFMHRNCALQLAHCRGYGFQCPICGEKENFQKYVCLRGVFIPAKDTLTQAHNVAVQESQTKYCEAELCLQASAETRREPRSEDKLITDETPSAKCGYCGKVFHLDCAGKQGIFPEDPGDSPIKHHFTCSSCMNLSEHELSISTTSSAGSEGKLNEAFDFDSHSESSVITVVPSSNEGTPDEEVKEAQSDEDSEERLLKRFKFDHHYEWQECEGYHNKEWRQFKLNLFMNTLRTSEQRRKSRTKTD